MSEQFHLMISPGDVGRYCILPGDPGRVPAIAKYLDSPKKIAANREFVTYTGELFGEKVSVCSTGIGGPSTAIAAEELHACGADTFIRIGTTGGINTKVKSGDLVIVSASVRQEGTSLHYAPVEYPASADFEVVKALADAANSCGYIAHIGVVQCKDSFYGQHSPERMPVSYDLLQKWEAWKRLGVLASEMETAPLFVVSAALGCRAGAVLNVLWNQERKAMGLCEPDCLDTEKGILCSIEAIKLLIQRDKQK